MTTARELATSPHLPEHGASAERQDRIRHRPTTLRQLIRWAKASYALEPPAKLHSGRELADDGDPAMTGEALRYLGFSRDGAEDWVAVACGLDPDGYYVTPMRCAIERLRRTNKRQADIASAVVTHVFYWKDALGRLDPPVAEGDEAACVAAALYRVYDMMSAVPVRRRYTELSEAQKKAEDAA